MGLPYLVVRSKIHAAVRTQKREFRDLLKAAALTGWHFANEGRNVIQHWRYLGLLPPSEDPEAITGEEADQEIAEAYQNEDAVRQALASMGRRAVDSGSIQS